MLTGNEPLLPSLDVNALLLAYVVVAGLLLSLNVYSSWNWAVKSLMNVVVVAFFWVTYQSWPGVLGWPTSRDLPRQFYLHAINIDEPAYIHLWATDLDRGMGRTVPRAFAVPYSTKLHDTVAKAGRKLRKGLPVIGQIAPKTAAEVDLSNVDQSQSADTEIVFIDAPAALVPGKN